MQKISSKLTKALYVLAMFSLAILLGACSSANANNTTDDSDTATNNDLPIISADNTADATDDDSGVESIEYGVNANGQTYGPMLDKNNLPDLIAVVATNGQEGYVYREDYTNPGGYVVNNPADAAVYMDTLRSQQVDAFVEYVYQISDTTVDATRVWEAIEHANLPQPASSFPPDGPSYNPWRYDSLSSDVQQEFLDLLPEGYQTVEVAREALTAAAAGDDIIVIVYESDGITEVGVIVVQ